nr:MULTISPECIES: DUF6207 family protein [Streptomyces]
MKRTSACQAHVAEPGQPGVRLRLYAELRQVLPPASPPECGPGHRHRRHTMRPGPAPRGGEGRTRPHVKRCHTRL